MPTPKPLSPFQAKRTLANRFARQADRLRQFSTKFGVRPYRVFLVWSKFTGSQRGEGTENLLKRFEILPTPKVAELTALQLLQFPAGTLSTGTLRVDNISATLTQAQLMGYEIPGEGQVVEFPNDVDFFWEIKEDDRGGDTPVPLRFRLVATPVRLAGNVSWSVILERQDESPKNDDSLPFAIR